MKKLVSIVLALALVLLCVGAAMADPSITINPANESNVENIDIDYVAYRILEADIDTDPVVAADGSTTTAGTVAYFVTTQDRADELAETNLFNITRVGTTNKWYVELKSASTTADQLVAAFSAETFDLSKFESTSFDKAANETNAQSGNVDPGYYYITSTLGSKIALQTLTAVTINEKNDYTTDDKIIPEEEKNSEIGKVITYTLEVNVPVTANKAITLTDTMSRGLTYKGVQTQSPIEGTVAYNSTPDANGATSFTITYTAEQIAALVAGKTSPEKITVTVNAMVNGDAAIETDIPNTLDLDYGNVYQAIPDEEDTKTYKVTFDKVDGTNKTTKLTGAEFKLTKVSANTATTADGWMGLVAITPGQLYRLATADDDAANIIDTIVTDGNTVQINGLDFDLTYYLVETKAPTGYNLLAEHVELTKDTTDKVFIHQNIENNKGTTLPSTGGIGTTIFYILGGLLVVGAAVILVARRKAQD